MNQQYKYIKLLKSAFTAILLLALLMVNVGAFTTNGTEKNFNFAITSGKNSKLSSGNFTGYFIVGETAGSASSSSFNAQLGFSRVTGYLTGESCSSDAQCTTSVCCNGICQEKCETKVATSGEVSKVSAGSGLNISQPYIGYRHYFDSIDANKTIVLRINNKNLAITEILLILNEKLDGVDISIEHSQNPEFTIDNNYTYFKIESSKINKENLKSFIIKFKVRTDSGYIKETVTLNKYSETDKIWKKLTTKLIGEYNTSYFYESIVDGFSLFAITGEKREFAEALKIKEPQMEEPTLIEEPVKTEEKKQEVEIFRQSERKRFANVPLISVLIGSLAFLIFLAAYSLPMLRLKYTAMLLKRYSDLSAKFNISIEHEDIHESKDVYLMLLSNYKKIIGLKLDNNEKIKLYNTLYSDYKRLKSIMTITRLLQ